MRWLRWVVIVLVLAEAGWMTFDGTMALMVVGYVIPRAEEYAGRLWT